MWISAPTSAGPPRRTLEALVLAAAFAAAHTQAPLYYSNQNQYLLHGAALADSGHLARDWLANTRDPTPLFSVLVAAAYSVSPRLLQPAYFVLLMGYFLAARSLAAAVPGFPASRAARVAFAALVTAAHAAVLRWASVELTGVDYPWYLQAGLAAQYLLGPGIQPSAFGVLLLVAVAAFAHRRPTRACAVAASACLFHSTYLLAAGLLVCGFLAASVRQRDARAAVWGGAIALAVAAPVVAYTVWRFEPFGPDAAAAAHVLARVRIPHHCVPARWFDLVAGVQLAWVALGLVFLRRTPLGTALGTATALAAALTGVQLATDSDALALMFPWRVSALLVPVATAAISAEAIRRFPPGAWGGWCAAGTLLALVAGGVAVTACGLGYRTADESALADYVRATAGPGDVYLLPVAFPAVGTGRGAVSNTFAPPPRAKPGTDQIPVDLQRFRLTTGACAYVDFKSVPYAPSEVREWYRRMTLADDFNAGSGRDGEAYRAALKREGITYVVAPVGKPLAADFLAEVYADGGYIVYRVK
jgi:hypothetical protein